MASHQAHNLNYARSTRAPATNPSMLDLLVPKSRTLDELFRACTNFSLDSEIDFMVARYKRLYVPFPKPPKPPSRPNPYLTVTPGPGLIRTTAMTTAPLTYEDGPPPRGWNVQTYQTRRWDSVDSMYAWAAERYRPGCRIGALRDYATNEALLWVATRPSWVHEPTCDVQIAADYQDMTGFGLRSVDEVRAELGVVPLSSLTCTCDRGYAPSAVQPR